MTHTTKTSTEIHYFASGSNHEGEIQGLQDCGYNVGVAVDRVNARALCALCELAGTGTKVFVDSGAFSEIKFSKNAPPRVKKAITHEQWIKRLELYVELATVLGSQVYLVAPDKVAFQADTLERMRRYAGYMQRCRELGANILVPHQKGELALSGFGVAATMALGFSDWIPAIPMKKDATTTEDLVEYLIAVKPAAVHLLGRGLTSKGWDKLVAAARAASPRTTIFCDSVLVKSLAGRENGRVDPRTGLKGPRVMTVAFDAANAELEATMWGATAAGMDYTDEILMDIEEWFPQLTKAQRAETLTDLAQVARTEEPTEDDLADWLQENSNAYTDAILDALWSSWVLDTGAVTWRKRDAINHVFRGEPAPRVERQVPKTKPVQLTLALAA